MQNARGPNSGPIDFREPSGETVGLHHRRQFHAPLRPSSSFREGSPCNLNIRHPSARAALPTDCTFGIFRPPCAARSRSLRAWNTRTKYLAVIISYYTKCQIVFRRNSDEKVLKNHIQYFYSLSNLNVTFCGLHRQYRQCC